MEESASFFPKADISFQISKLTSVFHASVLLLIMNLVITLSNVEWTKLSQNARQKWARNFKVYSI